MLPKQREEVSLESLSVEQWAQEIRAICHMTAEDFFPFSKRYDSPYQIVHETFRDHESLRPRILDAMRTILKELHDPDLWTPDGQEEFLSAFAYLDKDLIPEGKSLVPDLVNLLESGIKTGQPDAVLRTELLALLSGEFRYPGTIPFWEEQYRALGDEASFSVFRGLLNSDLNHAIERLPALFERMQDWQKSCLFISLGISLCQPTPSGLERTLRKSMSSLPSELCEELEDQTFPEVDAFEKAMEQFYAGEEICVPGHPNYPMYLEEMRKSFPTEQNFRTWQAARKPVDAVGPAPAPAPIP